MAQPKRMHLGWFVNFTVNAWNEPWADSSGPDWTGGFYVDMARALDRACFDYIILEDTCMVSEAYGDSFGPSLKHAVFAPKHDPVPLVPLIAQATSRLGVVATMSTSFYPPFLLARLSSTLDHICRGRFGWNIVTSGEDLAAQNFGMEKLPEHDLRYDIADEYVDLECQLWDSWEPGAVVMDRATGVYADGSKVHRIDFNGRYFKSRGPLNTVRPPQGRPVFIQADGSPRGREFAAQRADSITATATGIEGMKADFSVFDLDEPLPAITTNGERGSLDKFAQWGSGKTLRQLAAERVDRSIELVDTPDQVAERMGEVMEEVGGDGFLITRPGQTGLSRKYITEIADGLIPALQRRGLARTDYTHQHFRDNLLEF